MGRLAYHVLDRGVGRMELFGDEVDYGALERVVAAAVERRRGARLPGYCLMANHSQLGNDPLGESELAAVRRSLRRGSPCGVEPWVRRTAKRLGLESSLRPRGRRRVRPEKPAP